MKFQRDGGFLAYDRVGTGLPLLFLHGYPLSRKIWQPQLESLSDIATLLTVDLRGHGESYPFDPPYSMDMLAEDCLRLLDHENIAPPIVVCGLSMGGYVAFALYRKYPHLFKGLVLTSTRAAADSPEAKANRQASIKNVHERGVPFIVEGMLPMAVSPSTLSSKPDLVDSIRQIMLETSVDGVVGALQGMLARPDSTPLLPAIPFPVLVISGADDRLIPSAEAGAMAQLIPHSRLVVIPQAGHLPNLEQPALFNAALRDFLASLS